MSGYPIELKMEGRTVVVVGLGPVGRHKAAALVAAGARVIGVDPAAGNLELATLAGIEVVAQPYQAEQLHGASLVIAAGPTEVNGQVVADARRIGAWVCSTSDPEAGGFHRSRGLDVGPTGADGIDFGSQSGTGRGAARPGGRGAGAGRGRAGNAAGRASPPGPRSPDRLACQATDLPRLGHPRWLSLWTEQGPDAVRQALWRRIEDEPS